MSTPIEQAQQTGPVKITALLSEPAMARDDDTGETGFAIIVQLADDKRAAMFLPQEVADALEHALSCGHLPKGYRP